MNKQDPKFIKDEMIKYVEKVSNHHYQHNANKEKPGDRVMYLPYMKDDKCLMIVIGVRKDESLYVSGEFSDRKRTFKEQLFHMYRTYHKLTSVKRYKVYEEIVNKAKQYLKDHEQEIKDLPITENYSAKIQFLSKLEKYLNS